MRYYSIIICFVIVACTLAAKRDSPSSKSPRSSSNKPSAPPRPSLPPDFDPKDLPKDFPGKQKKKEKRVLTPKEQQQLRKTQLAWRYEVLFAFLHI